PSLKGTIENGALTVDKSIPGQQGYVEAKVGTLTARARVRVAPRLPYKLDVSKVPLGGTPGGWVNTQGKFEVVERDGRKLLMKFTVEQHDDKAVAKGKIWPRGQPEPTAWTIEVEDPRPNRSGSPALFAFATGILQDKSGAESFFDNVSVTPNP